MEKMVKESLIILTFYHMKNSTYYMINYFKVSQFQGYFETELFN